MADEDRKLTYVRERLAEFKTTHADGLIERYGVEAIWQAIQEVASKGVRNPGAWVRKRLEEQAREGIDIGKAPSTAEFITQRQALYDLGVPEPATVVSQYGADAVRLCVAALARQDPAPRFPAVWLAYVLQHGLPDAPKALAASEEDPQAAAYGRDLGLQQFRRSQQSALAVYSHVAHYGLLQHRTAVSQPEIWDTRTLDERRTAYCDALHREYWRLCGKEISALAQEPEAK